MEQVSILVLVDVALRHLANPRAVAWFQVSILVLVDVALRRIERRA